MDEHNCKMYTQNESIINGRGIWHYLISTPIGNFNIISYEKPSKEIERKIFDERHDDACKYYNKIAKAMLEGK